MCECAECGEQVPVADGHEWGPDDRCWVCLDREVRRLRAALARSVKLQSHYAGLLNMYDGGARMKFESAETWMARLDELG